MPGTRNKLAIAAATAAALLAACGQGQENEPAPPPDVGEILPVEDHEVDLWADFDRDRSREDAERLLGLDEADVTETPERRIVRRGDEHFAVTMDLRPGRQNVELDDDGSGTYVVTRVVVEVPDGEDPLVVE